MPITLPPEIIELRKTYQDAQKRLLEIIANQEATGTPTAYRKRILAGVNEELRILDKYANEWVNKNVVDAYKGAMIETYQVYRDANITVPAVSFNTAVVKILTENAASKFLEAHNFVGRRIDDEIRKATVSVIAEKVSTGMTVKQVKQRLLESFADNGIKAIKDKNGKQISLDAYAEMVGRTTTREATNQGTIDEMHSVRGDLVKMSQHFSSCPVCVVYEGRVYSISGNDKRFPALYETAFKGGYNTIHPNCTHQILPVIPKYNDMDALEKESNRPFEIQENDKKSIEDYNKRQDKKREQRIARQKWEQSLVNDPTTPKTFAGYQSRQRALDKVKKKEVKKESTNQIDNYGDVELLSPHGIKEINPVTDNIKYAGLVAMFEEKGYTGRPILVMTMNNEEYEAITGSHRILAARKADIEIPAKVIYLEDYRDMEKIQETRDDIATLETMEKLYKKGIIDKESLKLLRDEVKINSKEEDIKSKIDDDFKKAMEQKKIRDELRKKEKEKEQPKVNEQALREFKDFEAKMKEKYGSKMYGLMTDEEIEHLEDLERKAYKGNKS